MLHAEMSDFAASGGMTGQASVHGIFSLSFLLVCLQKAGPLFLPTSFCFGQKK
jgi:hypothetical protein